LLPKRPNGSVSISPGSSNANCPAIKWLHMYPLAGWLWNGVLLQSRYEGVSLPHFPISFQRERGREEDRSPFCFKRASQDWVVCTGAHQYMYDLFLLFMLNLVSTYGPSVLATRPAMRCLYVN
jgi:hypothetical protein